MPEAQPQKNIEQIISQAFEKHVRQLEGDLWEAAHRTIEECTAPDVGLDEDAVRRVLLSRETRRRAGELVSEIVERRPE